MNTQVHPFRFIFHAGCLLLPLLLGVLHDAHAQKDKRLTLAETYFANGDYFTAAQLYEQFLSPLDKKKTVGSFPVNPRRNVQGGTGGTASRLDVLYKQAESFRLANYLIEASSRYKECMDKDPDTYYDAFYWHAVCQRGLGFYSYAEESLQTFLRNYASRSKLREQAEEELATLRFIRQQLSRPDTVLFTISKSNAAFGGEKGVYAPVLLSENRYVVTSTVQDSTAAPGTNPFRNRLFTAVRNGGVLTDPELLALPGVSVAANQGAATVSPDGNTLYFTEWKRINGKNQAVILYTTRTGSGWSQPQPVQGLPTASNKQPWCTADGSTLFFASDAAGGQGGYDLYSAPLLQVGKVGSPVNLGSIINTPGDEQAPFYHTESQTLVFASNGRRGMGGFDLYQSKASDNGWQTPVNMGHPINSSRDDIYYFVPENQGLLQDALISSDRGSNCCLETWAVTKAPKRQIVTGLVRDRITNEPVSDALVEVTDGSGNTLRVRTDAQGRYSFPRQDPSGRLQLRLSKDNYKDKSTDHTTERIVEDHPLNDTLHASIIIMEKLVVIKPEEVVIVYFDFDKSKLKQRGKEQLDSLAAALEAVPGATIQVSGHTDGLGSETYNLQLGERRAKAVKAYLVSKGIAEERISIESFGKCCPVELEMINGRDNPDGRARNRRALVNVTRPE